MKPKTSAPHDLVCLAFGLLAFIGVNTQTAYAQQVQVNAADPAAAAQATVNLDVKVTGKGFKNGANAKFLVTGTADPGGVQVNSTTFVSSTELRVNIDVAETATIAGFDIQVLNSDGRGGKGTELFRVVEKGANSGVGSCPAPAPAPTSDTKCYSGLAGCLDTTFGSFGLVTTDTLGPNFQGDIAETVVVQTDGKILAVGNANNGVAGTGRDFAVVRYNTDGSLDTSFGDLDPINPPLRRGYVLTSFTSGSDQGQTALLQSDGKIVVGGFAQPGGFAIARYNGDGTLDTTFGSAGKTIVDFASSASLRELAMQSDGKLVLIGYAGSPSQFGVARLNPNGTLDSTFGTGGKLLINPSTVKRGRATGYAIVIQRVPAVTGEERIVVGGWADHSGSTTVFTMIRLKPNGTTDPSFGTSGRVYTSFLGFGDQIRELAVDSTNRLVAAGISNSANLSCGSYVTNLALARYSQDGALDSSFSGDGRQTADVYGGSETLFKGLVLQTDGRIIIAGSGASSDNTVRDFALVRFNSDGTPDTTFGYLGTGVVTTDFFGTSDQGMGIALQPSDGKIVMCGGAGGTIGLARYWP